MAFDADTLARFRSTNEVRIETQRASGETQRTVIWVVADDRDAYVRSVRGARGAWYRHLLARPEAVIEGGGTRIPVRAQLAADDATVELVSELLRAKYVRRSRASTESMLQPETLPTTMRLLPR